jgi:hypothetical protein
MTGTAAVLADLLAECDAHGIRLALADGGGLEIDAPQNALTPELLARLKAHKAELLAVLRPAPSTEAKPEIANHRPVQKLQKPKPVCRCGSTTWRDVVLSHAPHNGTTIRRDCAGCGRFLDFPVWYGRLTGFSLRRPGETWTTCSRVNTGASGGNGR